MRISQAAAAAVLKLLELLQPLPDGLALLAYPLHGAGAQPGDLLLDAVAELLLLLLLLLAAGGRSGLVVDGSRVAEDAPAAARGAGKVGVEAP